MTCLYPEQILEQAKIPFRVFTHQMQPESLQAAALARGQQTEQVVRTILFRKGQSDFLVVLAPGDKQISWKKLRENLHIRRISTATWNEVLIVTGYEPGTVSPLGLPPSLPIYFDSSIAQKIEISFGSGEANKALILDAQDLLSLLPDAIPLDFEDNPVKRIS
jgi:Cys-tRNA(Pro) deacylase